MRIEVQPASAEYGIWFQRVDVSGVDPMIPARWDCVTPSPLCTRIENDAGVHVSTIEHLMAALAGCGIHNALINIDGPEVPILDGSSADFVAGFVATGIRRLGVPVRALRILQPIQVQDGEAIARLEPCDNFEIDFRIDFEDAAIGQQSKRLRMANGAFIHELCDSRTFCRQSDVDAMREKGLALGGSLENAVVVAGEKVLSPGGLRHEDEAVRHKMLDAMGDLALATCPILGRYTGIRAGHALSNKLLRALFANPASYRPVMCDAAMTAKLPGSGIGRADIAGLRAAA
ncbi:UDP-3-O-[3-hydroxymyristoyl] N-acetylglucosamine deacetylase [Candidatus Rhodobacter oscarellae]|uniref:UDP-3-O-acyl-N-acetylglucosamine deacetylase n=1 Tax=Candidatus Rhodobacter oscarellae TaxID=1675527 RepID=A0A0J9E6L3_9RHOB|nr:UDP-3-O-[3-hydroxymyristoyl] N-acetylglucosamine deacetylase [Candidatus Rhodobacter lobularis]